MTLAEYLTLALQFPATIYGLGEMNCGDVDRPRACLSGAITASGERFEPGGLTGAIPLPQKIVLRPFILCLRGRYGQRVYIRINDKANPRWIGVRGLDLTPGAWRALGYNPTTYHSAKVEICEGGIDHVRWNETRH